MIVRYFVNRAPDDFVVHFLDGMMSDDKHVESVDDSEHGSSTQGLFSHCILDEHIETIL